MRKNNLLYAVFLILLSARANAVDRVFTADEITNTISMIDPSNNTLVGLLSLGKSRPQIYSSLLEDFTHINVHGLDISPDNKYLAATSNLSNSVALIELESNKVVAQTTVGRSPHIANFSPNGKELWVAVRSENQVTILDSQTLKEIRKIPVNNGPSAFVFSKIEPYAFVLNAFHPELEVVNTITYKVIKKIPLRGSFSPVGSQSPDGTAVWVVQKDLGEVARINPRSLNIDYYAPTGKYTQHVFAGKSAWGLRLYATVGGEEKVKIYNIRDTGLELVKSIPVRGIPHGIWTDPKGKKVYVGMEYGDQVAVLNSEKNYAIEKYIPMGSSPQALIYAQGIPKVSTNNLSKLYPNKIVPYTFDLQPRKTNGPTAPFGAVSVRNLGVVDSLQILMNGLKGIERVEIYLKQKNKSKLIGSMILSKGGAGLLELLEPSPSMYFRKEIFGPDSEVEIQNKQNHETLLIGKFQPIIN